MKKKTTGRRIADDVNLPSGYAGHKVRAYIARRIDSALKRAVREAYDEGWSDGGGTNKSNDGWNRLARKYGMVLTYLTHLESSTSDNLHNPTLGT